jgi:homogentisate 1,2-dioxygenase
MAKISRRPWYSIGVEWTDELAVMVDTFKPLRIAKTAREVEDPDYWKSWQP